MSWLNPMNWIRWLGALALAAATGAVLMGRNAKKLAQGKRDGEYVETRQRTDNADVGSGDVGDDTDWLSERKSGRDL